jgi:excisionase family DNA binding protein
MARRKKDLMENWITTAEAAELLGVTATYVGILARRGVFETRKVNNRLLLVNRQSLAGWTRKRKRKDKPIEE